MYVHNITFNEVLIIFSATLWDCDECKNSISLVANGYASDANEIIDLLQNDFCMTSGQGLDCQNFMPLFIPGVLDQISKMLADNSAYLCTEFYSVPCNVAENQVRMILHAHQCYRVIQVKLDETKQLFQTENMHRFQICHIKFPSFSIITRSKKSLIPSSQQESQDSIC